MAEALDHDRPTWMMHGACVGIDPELFFPSKHATDEGVAEAKQVCAGCPVRDECLDHAITHGEKHGIWGGKTPRERLKMRQRAAVYTPPRGWYRGA